MSLLSKKPPYYFYYIGFFALAISAISPIIHDYIAYKKQWDVIIKGNDPYAHTGNAYGVIYNLFAYIKSTNFFHTQRIVFTFIYILASFKIWSYAVSQSSKHANILLAILLINPLFWIFGIKFGINDTFLSGLTALAILCYIKDKHIVSGILFAIAVGFKFSPLFIIPFFIFSRHKINYKLGIAFGITTLFIFIYGYYLWGSSITYPFTFGADRESKHFSIFRFIRGTFQPLAFIGIQNMDQKSIYFVLSSVVICFGLYIRYNLNRMIMALLSFSLVLIFYKVGNHQFYFLLLVLTVFVYIQNEKLIYNKPVLKKHFIFFWMWFFFCVILYDYTYSYTNQFEGFREYISLPTFIIEVICAYLLLKLAFYRKRMEAKKME